jgi:RNA polymerase sigma factor (sigma-70 family)
MERRWNAMNDRQLLLAYVRSQDVQAFGAFVVRHENALLSFAAAFLRDEASAQDVVQEAFLRAARNPHRLLEVPEQPAGGRNWLLKVVRDLSVDCLRKRASERRAVEGLAVVAPKAVPAPATAVEGREELDRMRAAIANLKPRYRELLLLKVQEGKSYKEIALITGLSVTNVGFLLHQAVKELAEEMKD